MKSRKSEYMGRLYALIDRYGEKKVWCVGELLLKINKTFVKREKIGERELYQIVRYQRMYTPFWNDNKKGVIFIMRRHVRHRMKRSQKDARKDKEESNF